jgi:predicted ATPase/DNA-binding winged helix-turn-helix (wHTH) protein
LPAHRAHTGLHNERWELDVIRRELRLDDQPVELGSRAFDILKVLAEAGGELVMKDEIMDRVWLGTIVEENALQVHISAIRKALGAHRDLLKSAYGRGYRLTGNWSIRKRDVPAAQRHHRVDSPVGLHTNNFPSAAVDLIGRDAAAQYLIELLSRSRLVTLIGPGGIGKTVLALKVARSLFVGFEGDGFLVELASLSDPDLVPSAVARAVGLKLGAEAISAETVATALGARKLLLVLDNCEHLIDAAARLVETITRRCPQTWIVATTREILRVEGEHVYSVSPLEVPLRTQQDAATLLDLSAVQLFLARIGAQELGPVFRSDEVPAIAAICRALDGIPLAIEFAAARASILGVEEVARHLDERFRLLTSGRRTALPRHQTLRAALDWSYELLPEPERRLLRRLSVFPAGFTLDAASAIVRDVDADASVVIAGVANLVAKSLLVSHDSAPDGCWRYLETIRAYALEKLAGSGEGGEAARRHAEYYRDLLETAEAQWERLPMAELRAAYGWQIDNVRAAIGWTFAPDGDALLGVALTTAAIPLWMQLSLLEELRSWASRAIASIAAMPSQDMRLEMKLQTALGNALSIIGGAVAEIEATWIRTLHLAERLGDADHQLRALYGLWSLKDRDCVAIARQFLAAASTPADKLLGEDMIAMSSHWLGDLVTPRRHFERVLAQGSASETGRRVIHFQLNRQSLARTFLARILWLMGSPEQAIHTAQRVLDDARAEDHLVLFCHAAGYAGCPIALWVGDLQLAERTIALLLEYGTRHGLAVYRAYGNAYRGMLLVRQGDLADGLRLLREGFDSFWPAFVGYRVLMFLGELAEALGHDGRPAEGLATVDDALERAEQSEELWVMPELLRVKGELLRLVEAPGATDAAEACLRRALQLAGTQAALAWELRGAISMVRLLRDQSRADEGRDMLAEVYSRFTEGFETADLLAAKRLLDGLD